MAYIQSNSPFLKSNEPRKTTKGKGRNFRTVEEGAGMTKKGGVWRSGYATRKEALNQLKAMHAN